MATVGAYTRTGADPVYKPGMARGGPSDTWLAMTPDEQQNWQAIVDQNAQEFRDKVERSQRFGKWVGRGVLGVVGGAAGAGALSALGAAGAAGGAAGSAGSGSGMGAIAGGAPWAVTPYAAPVAMSGVGGGSMGVGSLIGSVAKSYLTDPETYKTLGSVLGNAGKGAADQRMGENMQTADSNRLTASLYNTNQNALLSALLAQSNEATGRYNTRQGATQTALGQQSNEGLQRAQLGLQAPSVRARQSLMGSLMKNLQPVQIEAKGQVAGRVPTITGGLTPAAIDPITREHGGRLMQDALQAQITKSDIPEKTDFMGGVLTSPEATDFQGGVLAQPGMTPMEQAGKLEKSLGAGGLLTSILGALAKQNARKPYNPAEPGETAGG